VKGGMWVAKRSAGLIVVACLVCCSAASADPVPPSNTAAPKLSGRAVNGQTLTVSNGSWTGVEPITYTYKWLRCNNNCVTIAGATAGSYTLTASDVNATIQAIVVAKDSNGNVKGAASNLVGPVGPSAAQIVASLSGVLSPHTSISAVLRRGGYSFTFKAPAPGTLAITWSSGRTTVASGHVNFTGTGRKAFTVRLTPAGRRALGAANAVTLTALAKFTPSFSHGAGSRKAFTLKR
jgi:hypothetical protein